MRKNLTYIYRQTIYFGYIDRLYNKEENPLLVKELGFCFAKQGGKSSARQRDSDFASQNKEENPLLAKGLAFSFGKQGGFYVKQIIDSG